MSVWATYHSVVDTIDGWTDSANAVDNNTGTYATNEVLGMKTMILDTPFAAASVGAISKVEHRMYGALSDDGVPCKLKLSPRFVAGDGTLIDVTNTVLGWSDWIDITADANAPGGWTWADVASLGANVVYWWGSGPVPLAQVAAVQIRVTYAGTNKPFSAKYYY